MAVTEVTEESWFSRLGGAFKGILTGIILFVLAIPLLFWNEGRAVRRAGALEKGAAAVVNATADKVLPENEGKLIHVSGMLTTNDTLADAVFGISIKGIRLERSVEMYQWKEKSSTKSEKQLGGSVKKTTVYTYEKGWSSSVIDSSEFKEAGHTNPGAFPFESQKWYASDVKLGAFTLQQDMIRRIGGEQPYAFPADYKLPANLNGYVANGRIMIPAAVPAAAPAATTAPAPAAAPAATTAPAPAATTAPAPAATTAPAPAAAPAATTAPAPAAAPVNRVPQIGDVRISFTQILPHNASVVAQQTKDSFCPYPVNGDTISLMSDSIQSAELMFSKAQSANNMLTWILRIVGFLMMLIGVSMVFKPLSVLADVLPIMGDIVEMGTSMVAFLIALPSWLIVIAIAWIVYRPVLGIILLVIAGAVIFYLIKKRKKNKPAAPTAAA